jgi:hypothetical protein
MQHQECRYELSEITEEAGFFSQIDFSRELSTVYILDLAGCFHFAE